MEAAMVEYARQSIFRVGLQGRCPRCGEGKLFAGFLKLAPRCNVCGLDYSFADPADGPAFFVMMTMAFPAVGIGMYIELVHEPPFWVHLLTTFPLLFLLCIPPLRPFKGVLVASQYVHKAEEGRLAAADLPVPTPSPTADPGSDVVGGDRRS
jgi:uncharacterized protein (DUF983 family)